MGAFATYVMVGVPKPVTGPVLVAVPERKNPLVAVIVIVELVGMFNSLPVAVTCWPTPAVGVDTVNVSRVASADFACPVIKAPRVNRAIKGRILSNFMKSLLVRWAFACSGGCWSFAAAKSFTTPPH
jgi:hypothetical protein